MSSSTCFQMATTEKLGEKMWKLGTIHKAERCTCKPTCEFTWVLIDLYYRCPFCNTINEALKREVGAGMDAVCEVCFSCKRHIESYFSGLGQVAKDYVERNCPIVRPEAERNG